MDAVNGLDITDDSASEITAELEDYYTVSDGWLSTYTFSFGQAVDWSIKWGMPVYRRATNQMVFRPRSIA